MSTTYAREVLADCERLVDAFPEDIRLGLWRPRWAGLVCLLRAVGHVLDKVDGETNKKARTAIAEAWNNLGAADPKPAIWSFIEDERNTVLKTYERTVRTNTTLRPGTAWIKTATGETGGEPSGPTTYEAFMKSGPFEGRDALELCREGIGFWREYLDAIDRKVKETA